ncbi:MAG TPA: hypothetical protein VLZ77_06935 [Acidimicrobiales bacterium]|nr:hypothetical protein [Acidimicrobiales bacterium]
MSISTPLRAPRHRRLRDAASRPSPGAGANGPPPPGGPAGGGRGGRLPGGRIVRRALGEGPDGLDLRNAWQVVAGSVLVPLGVALILMAWFGAAHTPYVQQQIPYLVSGSFAGLGCMVLGGLLYWAHWLYRLYDQADLHHEEQIRALRQTLLAVAERLGAPDAAPPASPGAPGGAEGNGRYVRTAEGSTYHDPGCPVVAHHPGGLRVVEGDAGGLAPCRICAPGGGAGPGA